MKQLFLTVLLALSTSSFASESSTGETNTFNCMDKKTFEISSECISQDIESNLVFKKAQQAISDSADNASDRALATMTFDSRNMTITIVAHKDAAIAKVDNVKNK